MPCRPCRANGSCRLRWCSLPIWMATSRSGAAARCCGRWCSPSSSRRPEIDPNDRVLDLGCATGYSAALMSRLAGSVVALEEDPELARLAGEALASVGANNVEVVIGPLAAGWPAGGPYDVIFLDGATQIAPDSLGPQLKPDGCVVGIYSPTAASNATIFHFIEGRMVGRPVFDAAARVLPGFSAPPQFVF